MIKLVLRDSRFPVFKIQFNRFAFRRFTAEMNRIIARDFDSDIGQ